MHFYKKNFLESKVEELMLARQDQFPVDFSCVPSCSVSLAASNLYGLCAISLHLQVVVQGRRIPLAGGLSVPPGKGYQLLGHSNFSHLQIITVFFRGGLRVLISKAGQSAGA